MPITRDEERQLTISAKVSVCTCDVCGAKEVPHVHEFRRYAGSWVATSSSSYPDGWVCISAHTQQESSHDLEFLLCEKCAREDDVPSVSFVVDALAKFFRALRDEGTPKVKVAVKVEGDVAVPYLVEEDDR